MLKKLSLYIDAKSRNSNDLSASKGGVKNSLAESFDFLSLIKAWREIAGDKLSTHTIPLKNQNGTLIILSNHSAFANELSFMELPLKKKIFERFPSLEKSILSIKFIVDTTHFQTQYEQFIVPMEKIEKRNSTLLHPFSPEYRRLKKEGEEFFKDIDDSELKEKMVSLYIQSGSVKAK